MGLPDREKIWWAPAVLIQYTSASEEGQTDGHGQ